MQSTDRQTIIGFSSTFLDRPDHIKLVDFWPSTVEPGIMESAFVEAAIEHFAGSVFIVASTEAEGRTPITKAPSCQASR